MGKKFPFLDELRDALEAIMQEDLAFAIKNSVPPEEDEEVLGFSLGSTFEDLTEAARAHVLLGHLARQSQEIDEGKVELPEGISKEEWLEILELKMDECEWFCGFCIRMMAQAHGIYIPDDSTPCVSFLDGEFRPVISEPQDVEFEADEELEQDVEDIEPVPESPPEKTLH